MASNVEGDALDLLAWFESLPNKQTTMTDAEQCVHLHWFVPGKGMVDTHKKRAHRRPSQISDVARLRRTRRWVDRQIDPNSLFAEYRFGTKRNGAGVTTTTLRGGLIADDKDAIVMQLTEMFSRILQAAAAIEKEHSRVIAVGIGDLDDLKRDHPLQLPLILAIDHAIRDLQTHGRLMQYTVQELRLVGIELDAV